METSQPPSDPGFERRCLAIAEAHRRMFGSDPTPGTVEIVAPMGYAPETSAQLLCDIRTLVHMVADPILDDYFLRNYGVPFRKDVKE